MTAQIVRGDSLKVLQAMPDKSADAFVLDPPYCSGGSTEATRRSAVGQGIASERMRSEEVRWFAGDNMTTAGLVFLLREIAFESERILKPGGSFVCFCDWRMWSVLAPATESGGLRLAGMIVWDKGGAGMGTGFKPTHELAIHLTNGTGAFHSKTGSNVLRFGRVHGTKKEHPTQKPVDLMKAIVRVVSPKGGLVIDPFCGSGSTGVACVQEERNFIGIERDAEFVATSIKRTGEARASPGLFDMLPPDETETHEEVET